MAGMTGWPSIPYINYPVVLSAFYWFGILAWYYGARIMLIPWQIGANIGLATDPIFRDVPIWRLGLDVEPGTLKEFEDMLCKDFAGPGPFSATPFRPFQSSFQCSPDPFPAVAPNYSTSPIQSLILASEKSNLYLGPLSLVEARLSRNKQFS